MRILQIHKIIDRKTPVYLREKLSPNRRPFLSRVFRDIKCGTNSFFPDAIASWNNFITHFEHFPTFDGLKDHLIALLRPDAKSIFGLHDPIGLRLLFQLRVSLSPFLNKKRYNFIDTLISVIVIKVLRIQVISYFHVLFMQMNAQPFCLM